MLNPKQLKLKSNQNLPQIDKILTSVPNGIFFAILPDWLLSKSLLIKVQMYASFYIIKLFDAVLAV